MLADFVRPLPTNTGFPRNLAESDLCRQLGSLRRIVGRDHGIVGRQVGAELYFVAGGAIQRGLYTQLGGQPAHADAWTDDAINRDVHDFYRATRVRLKGAWVRPRHSGYITFQHSAATTINEALTNKLSAGGAVDRLNELFELSFRM